MTNVSVTFSVTGFPFHNALLAPAYLPIYEGYDCASQDLYALSKLIGEGILSAAVRRGALGATSLRMPWIRTPETFQRHVGPPLHDNAAARDLWSYIDARDAGTAFRLAAERRAPDHRILFIGAADSYMRQPTEDLARTAYPDAIFRKPLPSTGSAIDCGTARAALGFVPSQSKQDVL